MDKINKNSFLFFNSHPKEYFNKLSKKIDPNNKNFKGYILKDLFFSEENTEIIQKQIVLSVYNKTNEDYVIPFQNNKSIYIMMKYIFENYAKNLPYNITEQIRDLNNKLTAIVTPMIIKNIKSRLQYLRDSSNPLSPFDRQLNVSSAGNKTLASVTSTF